LPIYMVPSAFVTIASMPLTVSGKLDRRALPQPELEAYSGRTYEPPHGDTEEALAELFHTVLGVDRVGRDDDFFELGGHSLAAMQLTARIQSTFSVTLPIRSMFGLRTVRQLADRIDAVRGARLLDTVTAGDAKAKELLERVTSMPESQVQELLEQLKTGARS
jgi:acyl carrier protein